MGASMGAQLHSSGRFHCELSIQDRSFPNRTASFGATLHQVPNAVGGTSGNGLRIFRKKKENIIWNCKFEVMTRMRIYGKRTVFLLLAVFHDQFLRSTHLRSRPRPNYPGGWNGAAVKPWELQVTHGFKEQRKDVQPTNEHNKWYQYNLQILFNGWSARTSMYISVYPGSQLADGFKHCLFFPSD